VYIIIPKLIVTQ